MKILVTQVLKDYENKPILKTELNERGVAVETKEELTLREVISTALNSSPRDKPLTAEKKSKAFQICNKLWSKKEVDLTLDDRAFIKERVGLIYNALVFGRISEVFEGKKGIDNNKKTN